MKGPALPDGSTMALTRTGPMSLEFIQKQNGKELYRAALTVSPDGKTITTVGAAAGTNEKTTAVYDRQ